MNDDLQKDITDREDAEEDHTSESKPQPFGIAFYFALAMVGLLVLLIIFVNIPGIRSSAGVSITRTDWTLQSYGTMTESLTPVKSGTVVTAVFDRNGTVSGSSGCNHYHANYTVSDFAITLSPPVSTKIFCSESGVMQQESDYLNDLPKAVELRISESVLILYDKYGKPVLVFSKE
jgi:heat shock protein HslJ